MNVVRLVFSLARVVLSVAILEFPVARLVLPVVRLVLPVARLVLPVARLVLPVARSLFFLCQVNVSINSAARRYLFSSDPENDGQFRGFNVIGARGDVVVIQMITISNELKLFITKQVG